MYYQHDLFYSWYDTKVYLVTELNEAWLDIWRKAESLWFGPRSEVGRMPISWNWARRRERWLFPVRITRWWWMRLSSWNIQNVAGVTCRMSSDAWIVAVLFHVVFREQWWQVDSDCRMPQPVVEWYSQKQHITVLQHQTVLYTPQYNVLL